jgi:hypothetical protein
MIPSEAHVATVVGDPGVGDAGGHVGDDGGHVGAVGGGSVGEHVGGNLSEGGQFAFELQ